MKSIESKLKTNWKSIENQSKSIENNLKSIEDQLKTIESKLKSIEINWSNFIEYLLQKKTLKSVSELFKEGGCPLH